MFLNRNFLNLGILKFKYYFSIQNNPLARVGKIPWRRKWQPTPVLLPGKSHGEKNLVGYSACGHKSVNHLIILKNSNQGLWKNYKEQGMYTTREAWWATVHGITKASEKT